MPPAALAAAGETVKQAASGMDLLSVLQSNLLGYGLLGIMFACLIFRKFVVPEWTLRKEEERHAAEVAELKAINADQAAQLQKLQTLTAEQLIPALTRATEVGARYNEELARRRWAGEPQ